MAQQLPNKDGTALTPSNYTEQRAPQFVGGSTDPNTGNIVPASKTDAATGKTPVAPPPETPTTRLADATAEPESTASSLAKAAGGIAAPYLGAQIGSQVGAGSSIGDALSGTASKITGALGLGSGSSGGALGAPSIGNLGTIAGSSEAALGSSLAPPLNILPAAAQGGGAATGEGLSSLGTLAGSSTIGAGVGAGLGTLLIGGLTGPGSFTENVTNPKVYQPAIGATVGTVIGSIFGPLGSIVGGFLGSMFCHAAGTMIRMADNSLKPIETIKMGDVTLLGDTVIGRGEVLADDLYNYRGTTVNGRHAVFEDGHWLRVEHSARATRLWLDKPILVYPLVTERHLLVCRDYICADFAETGDLDMSASERLARLNAATEENAILMQAERHLGFDARLAA